MQLQFLPALLFFALLSGGPDSLFAQTQVLQPLPFTPDLRGKAEIRNAVAIDIDAAGLLYILDRNRNQLLQLSGTGTLIRQIGGFGDSGDAFDDPRDVLSTTLDVFVADYNNNRVSRFDRNLNPLGSLTSQWDAPFDFDRVLSIAVSSQLDLFLLEDGSKKIVKFNRFSEPAVSFGGIFDTYGQLLEPQRLVLDNENNLYVSDPAQSAVIIFDYLGSYTGRLEHPQLQRPAAMHWGSDQFLYVVDGKTANIFRFGRQRSFKDVLTLGGTTGEVADLAIWQGNESSPAGLFALFATTCRKFALPVSPGRQTPQ